MTLPERRPPLLFYCQHSLGMGHLVRSMTLAGALSERFDVTLLNGGRFPAGFAVPPRLCIVDLPPLGMDEASGLVSLDPRWTVAAALEARRAMLARALAATRPRALVIELFPFGRKKFAAELTDLVAAAHALGARRPLVLCSLRDLLVGSRRDQQAHDDRACALANRWFDAILVHADPAFARLEESFRPRETLRVPVHYTGFVTAGAPVAPGRVRARRVVVSAGGGMVGFELLRDAIAAQRLLAAPVDARRAPRASRVSAASAASSPSGTPEMRVVAGPFLPEAQWRALQALAADVPGLELVRAVPSLVPELAAAAVSVSQCGYNTALEVLASGARPIVVPFAAGREDEQRNRAARLAARGLVEVIDPLALEPARLAATIRAALDAGGPAGGAPSLAAAFALDGARESTRRIAELLAGPDAAPSAPEHSLSRAARPALPMPADPR